MDVIDSIMVIRFQKLFGKRKNKTWTTYFA